MNSIKTVLLLGGLSGLFLMLGQSFGGEQGLVLALGFAVLLNFASYFFSEKMALSMSGAQRVSQREHPEIYRRIAPMTERLTQKMNLPMPKLWVLPEESPNAFATGRNPSHSSVALSAGLLEVMSDAELEAVIAHELGHILNRDILISSVAATVAVAITALARFGVFFGGRRDDEEGRGGGSIFMLFLAPIAAVLIQMAISRTREYGADAAAAKYTGSAAPMINALRKLDSWSKRIPMDASPAMSHMYIFPPMLGGLGRLFSTHPTTEQRIASLMGRAA